ncbi:hypothetical protein YC2023_066089 [Brassica napus]
MTSVGVRQHTQDVRGCPSAHIGRQWLSISTHISTLVLGLSTLALPADCLDDFGPRGVSIQYTQDVRGCPPAHTGCPWLSVAVHQHTQDVCGCPCVSMCVRVCPSTHTRGLWLSISTHISTLVLGLSTLALPVDCSGDFGPRRLSVQYTQDVRGFPSAHTGRPCVSVSTHRTSLAVRVCPCVSVCVRQHTQDVRGCPSVHISARCTHMTSVGVRQHTHDVCGFPSAHTGRPCLSISTHSSTLVLGLSMLTFPMDCSVDLGPRGLSVQYTQDIRGCPPAHTGHPWLSVCVRLCPSAHTRRQCLTYRTSVGVRQHTEDVRGCSWLSVSTHRMSVAVRQHTHDVRVSPLAHTGRPYVSVCVCVCPSAHKGRLWLFISTHISMLVLGLSTLALPMDCLGDFGPCGLSVQYTQDVCGCRPAHTGRPTHISTLVLGLSTLALPVDCLCDFGPRGLSVQYTQDVRGCPPVHTGRPWLFEAVRGCPSAHTGRLWLSVSTHKMFVAVCVCPCVSAAHT